MTEELKMMFNTILEEMERMENRINKRMDYRFDQVDRRFDQMDQRLESMQHEINACKLERDSVGLLIQESDRHEKRIEALERKIA